jgi:hypothetical protein
MAIDINFDIISVANTTVQERELLINKYINLAAGAYVDDDDLQLLFMYTKGTKELSEIRSIIIENIKKGGISGG